MPGVSFRLMKDVDNFSNSLLEAVGFPWVVLGALLLERVGKSGVCPTLEIAGFISIKWDKDFRKHNEVMGRVTVPLINKCLGLWER